MTEEKTDVLKGNKNIHSFMIDRLESTREKYDGCHDHIGPSELVKTKSIEAYLRLGKKGVKIRYLTDIRKENLSYCKEILKIHLLQMRHLNGIKGNFVIEDGRSVFLAGHASEKEGKPIEHLIFSTVVEFIDAQQYLFDNLWTKAMPAEYRIRELEEGVTPEVMEILSDSDQIDTLAFDLIKSARNEILIMFTISNPFIQQQKIKGLELLQGAALLNKVMIKILTSPDEQINEWLRSIGPVGEIETRNIEPVLHTNIVILVVDRKFCLIVEVKERSEEISSGTTGLGCYSNSKLTVLGYSAIFNALWKQSLLYEQVSKLYEEVRNHDLAQREFIATVAHELRNPIQSITGLSDILRSRNNIAALDASKEEKILDIINRNAKRLRLLTEDILDVERIERKTLELNKTEFNIQELVNAVVQDHQNEIGKSGKPIRLMNYATSLKICADQNRIYQVISNLVNNAIKFMNKGKIKISTSLNVDNNGGKSVTVSVKDEGTGIDDEFFPRLFKKFSSRSTGGTGLGLFICKNIIEAHGGSIWVLNNAGKKGATFGFSLPLGGVQDCAK